MTRNPVDLAKTPTRTRALARGLLALALSVTAALSVVAARQAAADSATSTATSSVLLDEQTKAKRIADPDPLVVVNVLEDALQGSCRLYAKQGGKDRKGVKGTFDGALIDANTLLTLAELPPVTGRTDKNGELVVEFEIPRQGGFAQQVAVVASVNVAGGKKVTAVHFTCELADQTP